MISDRQVGRTFHFVSAEGRPRTKTQEKKERETKEAIRTCLPHVLVPLCLSLGAENQVWLMRSLLDSLLRIIQRGKRETPEADDKPQSSVSMAKKKNNKRGAPRVLPGLVPAAYRAGSWHTAPTPELVSASVDQDGSQFEWRAEGTSVYTVTARGRLQCDGEGFSGLVVDCSCPDAERQKLRSLKEGTLFVCKHAAAALKSVEDPHAIAEAESQAKRRKTEAAEQRQLQDTELPGERARIEYGLETLPAEEIVQHLSATVQSLDGLRKLVEVFPTSVMPNPALQYCVRCGKNYDMQILSQRVCRVEHPDSAVRTKWDTSKKSWDECERCGKTFNCHGFHYADRRAVEDEGPWCFEGEHTADEELVAEEGWDKEYY